MVLFRLAPAHEKSGVVPPRFFAAVNSLWEEAFAFISVSTDIRMKEHSFGVSQNMIERKRSKYSIRSCDRRANPLTWYYHIFSFAKQEKITQILPISRCFSVFSLFSPSPERNGQRMVGNVKNNSVLQRDKVIKCVRRTGDHRSEPEPARQNGKNKGKEVPIWVYRETSRQTRSFPPC